MKGPGLRIYNDVRRRWRCPETGKLLKTPGSVTHLYSPFVKQALWMKLEEEFTPTREQVPLQVILEKMVIEAPPEEDSTGETGQGGETSDNLQNNGTDSDAQS